ncbi:MAG: adaptor protein MecA [Clostridiales bacterium]|nr:adaptor protein MecA [Clostridiales bacterium]
MTITKAGDDSVLITISSNSDEFSTQINDPEFSKIREMARSVISMLGLSWPGFGIEIYSYETKHLIFIVREKKKTHTIFAYNNIDDLMDAYNYIQDLPDASLFLLDEMYYLFTNPPESALSVLLEFSFSDENQPSETYIKEHGKKILDSTSLKKLNEAFANKKSEL